MLELAYRGVYAMNDLEARRLLSEIRDRIRAPAIDTPHILH